MKLFIRIPFIACNNPGHKLIKFALCSNQGGKLTSNFPQAYTNEVYKIKPLPLLFPPKLEQVVPSK